MSKTKGGSGLIYAQLSLSLSGMLHDLEEEKPGTVGRMILAYIDYAAAHAADQEAPEELPPAPEGFSLAARHIWQEIIERYHGSLRAYIAQVQGGSKAPPGPGRPKGSKNKPKEPQPDETAEEVPGSADPEDIRITGKGPWLPSESDLKKEFWAAALSMGYGESTRATVTAVASQVWGRLTVCGGYLAAHGMGGIDAADTRSLLGNLLPDYNDPDDVPTHTAAIWRLLDAWANLASPCHLSLNRLLDMLGDRDISSFGAFWFWREHKGEKYLAQTLLADLNEMCRREDESDADEDTEENPKGF